MGGSETDQRGKAVDLQKLRDATETAAMDILPTTTLAALPAKFYDNFIIEGIRIDRVEPGLVICSMRVPPRLLNNGNFLHGGATASLVDIIGSSAFLSAGCPTSGVSMEINISYLDAAYANVLLVSSGIQRGPVNSVQSFGRCQQRSKHCILDESFVVFSVDKPIEGKLMPILDVYPGLKLWQIYPESSCHCQFP